MQVKPKIVKFVEDDLYKILRMLKIASSIIKIKEFSFPLCHSPYLFSTFEASKISQQTFALVIKRLQQKTIQARKIQEQLINSATEQSIKFNGQAMRMQLNKLSPLVSAYEQISPIDKNIDEINEMLSETTDLEEKSILEEEIKSLKQKKQDLKQSAIDLLISPDSYDDVQQIYLEFRPGAGGSESAIFVQDISEMYMSYAQSQGWRVSFISQIKETVASKGFKYLKLKINGQNCYKVMKCESGVHKVIRVPETESKGRIHSSTISMVVMPSLPFTFVVDNKDIKYQYTRSSGAGGQSVQKTDSACRATHIPTGLSVFIQQQRSQDQNRKRATDILKQRLFQAEYQKTVQAQTKRRKSQIGTMDRSQKIRTYNYPQDRITDHRTGLTLFGIESMMTGNLLQKFIDAYMNKVYEEKLEELLEDLKEENKPKNVKESMNSHKK